LDLKCDFEPHPNLSYAITIEMRGPGPALAQNCFAAFDPWLADKPNLMANLLAPAKFKGLAQLITAPHPACVWIKLGDPKAVAGPVTSLASGIAGSFNPMPPIGLLPPIEVCANGLPPLAGGRCPCPLSAPWDPLTRSCRWRPVCWDGARLAPDGRCCPRGTVWWASAGTCRVPPVAGCTDTRGGADPTVAAVRRVIAGATAPAGHRSLPSRVARASGGFPRAPALPCR
jgi:hypothetical protein